MKVKPDFYIVPDEGVPVVYPMACWVRRKCESVDIRGYLPVEVRPPILYSDSAQNIVEMEKVVLVARYEGETLEKRRKKPMTVNILRPKGDLNRQDGVSVDADFEIFALGTVYTSKKAAWKQAQKAHDLYWREWWIRK